METPRKTETNKLPQIFDFDANPVDRFMVEIGHVWKPLVLDETNLELYMKVNYPTQANSVSTMIDRYQGGVSSLRKLDSNQSESRWAMASNMPIPYNHHAHLSKLTKTGDKTFQFSFKDNESFKITNLPDIQLLALLMYDAKKSFLYDETQVKEQIYSKLEEILIQKEYQRRTPNLHLEEKSKKLCDHNPIFIDQCAESICRNIQIRFNQMKERGVSYLTGYFLEDLLNNKIPQDYDERSLTIILSDLYMAGENERVKYAELKLTIIEKLKLNQNGILDFLAETYLGSYNCGKIDFELDENDQISIVSGHGSCDNATGIGYLFEFLSSISNSVEKGGYQSDSYDIHFSGAKTGTKKRSSTEEQKYNGYSRNLAFPYLLKNNHN